MKQEKLYRIVIDGILEQIRSGRYPIGARLPAERELAEAYDVGRTTVREAMVALEMLEIVQMRQGSGVYVLRMPDQDTDADELDIGAFELIEARRLLEGEIAALAARYVTDEQLAQLDALLTDMKEKDELTAEIADREFHLVVATASGNSALVAASAYVWDMRERAPLARTILHRARGDGMKSRAKEHQLILDALRSRDPSAARQAMRAHLDRVLEHLLAITEQDEIEAARERAATMRHRLITVG